MTILIHCYKGYRDIIMQIFSFLVNYSKMKPIPLG